MVETITPVVHGGSRRAWAVSAAVHAFGATIAAAAFGAVLGGVGALLGAPWGVAGPLVVAAVAALYIVAEFGLGVPVPQLRRQVPDWWRTFFPPGAAAFLYGIGLGPGFLTHLTHGTFLVVALAAVSAGRPLLGAALVAPFGLARGLTVVAAFGVRTPAEGAALIERLSRSSGRIGWRLANAIALGAVLVLASARAISLEPPGEVGGLAAAVVTLTFGASGVAKLARWRTWRRALPGYGLPREVERVAAPAVPAAELFIAALPLMGLASSAGLFALVLLCAFSGAIVVARVRGDRGLDCGCFGAAKRRDYRVLLLRNGLLAFVAFVAWQAGTDASAVESLGVPRGSDLVPAVMAVAGLALVAWLGANAIRWLGRRSSP